jgi:hypothetical protein
LYITQAIPACFFKSRRIRTFLEISTQERQGEHQVSTYSTGSQGQRSCQESREVHEPHQFWRQCYAETTTARGVLPYLGQRSVWEWRWVGDGGIELPTEAYIFRPSITHSTNAGTKPFLEIILLSHILNFVIYFSALILYSTVYKMFIRSNHLKGAQK